MRAQEINVVVLMLDNHMSDIVVILKKTKRRAKKHLN